MLLRRINYFAEMNRVDNIQDLDALFDKREMRRRTRPSNYLLKRSMMRPRDLICYFRRVIDTMKEKAADPFVETGQTFAVLEAESIYDAEPGYSEWLKQELIDEWGVQKPIIKRLFAAMQNHGSTNITGDELMVQMQKMDHGITHVDTLQYLRFLFDNSVIGFKSGESTIWRYKCFYPSQGFVDADEYRVHDGLVRALNLKEPRDRE
jgi:hypothetical protein